MGITIKNLTKAFEGNIVIDNLSFSLPSFGLFRIGGASGVGKTTLLRIIAGLDKEYSGEVVGVGSTSFAFQEYRLFPWLSAIDNIAVASFEDTSTIQKKESEKILLRLGFNESEAHLRPSQLSGGMKQRVSLARAFMRKSDVLILDEPTKELDLKLIEVVKELICEASQDRLVIIVTHDTSLDELDYIGELYLG